MTHADSSSTPSDRLGDQVASRHRKSPTTPSLPAGGGLSVRSGPVVDPAVIDGVDVDAVARAVRACAGVSDLHSGRFGEIGSYLPGRRVVAGVQVADDALTVQIKARWGHSPQDLMAQIAGVTATLRNGRVVNLVVADVDGPGLSPPASTPTAEVALGVTRTPALETAQTHLSPPESSSS